MKVATFLVQVTSHSSLSCLIQVPYCVWPNYVVGFVLCEPNKVKIVIPFVSKHYSNFNSKSISITTNSLLSNVKDNKLKKVSDKYKVIHALKQPKDLLSLLSKPEILNGISKKYGLYRYERKDFRSNLWALYIQECSSFIT